VTAGRGPPMSDRPRRRPVARRPAGRSATPLLGALVVLAAACAGGSQALAEFDGEPEDFAAVGMESVEDPDGLRESALARIDEDSPARVGAIFALTLTAEPGPSMDALRDLLDADELTERLMAADALAARGAPARRPGGGGPGAVAAPPAPRP
jgi:hypothetical protein